MNNILRTISLSMLLSAGAHAGMITLDPSVFAPGTEVTHAYEGASLYTAFVRGAGEVYRESAYVQACTSDSCKPAVAGTTLFAGSYGLQTNPFFYAAADFQNDIVKQKSGGFGAVFLVEFDEPTDYVRVIGSGAQHQNQFMMDYWGENWEYLGRCDAGVRPDCAYTLLGPDYFDDQRLYELRLADPKIKYVSMAGYHASGYVSSVSFVKVPEPAPLMTLAGSLLILAGLRPRATRESARPPMPI
jgi:hypothetical protein